MVSLDMFVEADREETSLIMGVMVMSLFTIVKALPNKRQMAKKSYAPDEVGEMMLLTDDWGVLTILYNGVVWSVGTYILLWILQEVVT